MNDCVHENTTYSVHEHASDSVHENVADSVHALTRYMRECHGLCTCSDSVHASDSVHGHQVLQLEMERLSLNKAAPNDRNAASRLSLLDMELTQLKKDQKQITDKWQAEKQEMSRVQVGATCAMIYDREMIS